MYLSPPMQFTGCHTLHDLEPLIFARAFPGVTSYKDDIELSQKLIHSLDLYYMEEYRAYCRLDQRGDIEQVIKFYDDGVSDSWSRTRAVTIKRSDLEKFMALSDTAMITKFSFTRFVSGSSHGWDGQIRNTIMDGDVGYQSGMLTGQASYAHGQIIFRGDITVDNLISEWKLSMNQNARQYESFITLDWKNDRLVETSCSPDSIASYFEKNSPLPWQISPIFFRPDVLHKYKMDPEKYTVTDRSISCRGSWHLTTYDINEEGQVHTYIRYLADLPYEEQIYWKSFNEAPKASISKRAFENDILGQFSSERDPLRDLKRHTGELDREQPRWWRNRGDDLRGKVNYPVTDSIEEWGNAILDLDHLAVEGLSIRDLREIINENHGTYETQWGSIKLLEVALSSGGMAENQAREVCKPFSDLHILRNLARAHGDLEGRRTKAAEARQQHGSLHDQFHYVTSRICTSMDRVKSVLPK